MCGSTTTTCSCCPPCCASASTASSAPGAGRRAVLKGVGAAGSAERVAGQRVVLKGAGRAVHPGQGQAGGWRAHVPLSRHLQPSAHGAQQPAPTCSLLVVRRRPGVFLHSPFPSSKSLSFHLSFVPRLLPWPCECRCGIFLHSPFPSSEIFRTFPRREEIIRSMLNAGGWCGGLRLGLGGAHVAVSGEQGAHGLMRGEQGSRAPT